MGVTESDLARWGEEFAAFHARFGPHFFRSEVRQRSGAYLRALLGPVERKNGWQLAEAIGETDPNGTQRLLYQAVWNEDAVRDDLQAFVAKQFGDPDGIFVVDESGFLKKGECSNSLRSPGAAAVHGHGGQGGIRCAHPARSASS